MFYLPLPVGFGGAVHIPPSLTGEDVVDEPSVPIYDPENLEKCLAFAGNKLIESDYIITNTYKIIQSDYMISNTY